VAHLGEAVALLRRSERWHRHPDQGLRYLERLLKVAATHELERAVHELVMGARQSILYEVYGAGEPYEEALGV
jgi:hypothetical protein